MNGRWFGFGKGGKEVRLIPLAEAKITTFMQVLCEGFVAYDVPSLNDLMPHLRKLQAQYGAKHPACRVLTTLDDMGQASYTSGHTTDANNLDSSEGHDLSGLDPSVFEEFGEHPGYFSTQQEFPFRLANLIGKSANVSFEQLAGLLPWETEGDENDPAALNILPDSRLMFEQEPEVLIQLVPVARAADMLAAFPNGYFSCDLNPMQNHALALHFEQAYQLSLFGIGASLLGFWRDTPLTRDQAQAVATDVARLYDEAPADAVSQIAASICGKDHMFLRYSES